MSVLSFLSGLISPVTNLISEMHTSDEEKMALTNALVKMENEMSSKVLELEAKVIAEQSNIIQTEAKGGWLQRNWRPGMMVVFAGLLISYWLGYAPENITQQTLDNLFSLLKLGISGYIAARSLEKITPGVMDAIKNKK